ncbi:hypothetical protein Scep_028303 [Stephania cephalantha]|uniref:Uncharacterized protein n=1 Tax=Stephania cephalantha TaxID=152367 RepID=A0AAP0HLZ2_9MAGN
MFTLAYIQSSKHVIGASDEIWRYVGKLTDAQKSMLDDRFKWKVCVHYIMSCKEMDKRREGKPGEARAALRRSVRDTGFDVAEQSGEEVPWSISAPIFFVTKLQRRRREATRTTSDHPVDDEAVYYKVAGECPKGRVYGLGSLGRKKRRYADDDAITSQTFIILDFVS